MTTTTNNPAKAAALAEVLEKTRRRFPLETLDERGNDRLDFHEVNVGSLREAIEAAFEAGFAAGAASK